MTRLLLAVLLAIPLAAEERARIQGRVVYENYGVPGVTVRLDSRETVTDVDGRYAFDDVPPGSHELHYELSGFSESRRSVETKRGRNVLDDEKLKPTVEAITLTCGSVSCIDADVPDSRWGLAPCAEYNFNTPLIEAAGNGDRSAVALLRQRYERASTYGERHRIAGALLDDRAIWNELVEHAAVAVDVPRNGEEYTPEFQQWCEAHGVTAGDLWGTALDALRVAGADRRSRALLLRALESSDEVLIDAGIMGFARQRDESALPAIAAALERVPDHSSWMVMMLVLYRSEAADRVAFKFMPEEDREEYLQWRE